jgi:hypothetical protein
VLAARHAAVPLATHRIVSDEAAAVYGAPLVLVRPDGHVAWRGDERTADVAAVLATVTGNR